MEAKWASIKEPHTFNAPAIVLNFKRLTQKKMLFNYYKKPNKVLFLLLQIEISINKMCEHHKCVLDILNLFIVICILKCVVDVPFIP